MGRFGVYEVIVSFEDVIKFTIYLVFTKVSAHQADILTWAPSNVPQMCKIMFVHGDVIYCYLPGCHAMVGTPGL